PVWNAATVGYVNVPVSCVKVLTDARLYSPPTLMMWRPVRYVAVSEPTHVVTVRPWGKFAGPPKFRPRLVIVICGRPMAKLMPLLMPSVAGLTTTFGLKLMLMRL